MKKIFIFLTIIMMLSSVFLYAGDTTGQTKAKKIKGAEVVTVQGVTRSWKDVNKVPLDQRKTKRAMKPVLNFENPRKIVKKSSAQDPVVQDTPGSVSNGLERERRLIPAPIIQFAGMNLSQNGAGWPPDTCGDVGINHYVQAVNTSIGIYSKSTGACISTTTFDDFFQTLPSPCGDHNNGDPIVLYDQYAERWVVFDFAWDGTTNGSWFSIGASKTSDPTGDWWLYAFHADNTLLNDYPKGGVWNDGIYITANMFQFNGSFQHVKIWALKKPDLYNGVLTAQSVTDSSWEAWTVLPTHAKGPTPPPEGAPNYLYSMDADEYGAPGQDALYWWRFFVDWDVPANTAWDGPYTMLTAAFTLTASSIPQPGTANTLDSLYGRLMNPAIYRNFGTHGSVYLNHVCDYNYRRSERWYEVRINTGVSSIYQQGTYSPDSHHRWTGSIAADKYGSIALGYSVASTSLYPSIRYAGRHHNDTPGQLSQGEESIIEGTGSQTSYDRWGDYSSMTIDPVDDETFWYTNEYYMSSGTNWQTRIGAFKVIVPPEAPTNLQGILTNTNDVQLTWVDNSGDEEVFIVYRGSPISTSNKQFTPIATLNPNTHAYLDDTVRPATPYYYKVCAVNQYGESCSNTIKITTQ